ncbi:MAG: hypothetical protein ABIN89_05705 [Chitinophagaceae bacterium]
MRLKKMSFFISLLLICSATFSQKKMYKEKNLFGFAVNVGPGSFADAFSWSHYHGIDKNKRFKIGYGLRLTNFFGSDQNFMTAPAKYTSGKSSLAALFSENIVANIDTISFSKVQVNSLNAGVYLSYLLPFWQNKFELGVNIDVVGFSFGARQNALYKGNTVSAKPTSLSLLLISDSDIGSLNSEWHVNYWATSRLAIKAGYEFLFTEYTTDNKVQHIPNTTETNDRFRLKSRMILLGVLYAPFRK